MAGMWMLIGGSVLSAVASFAFILSGISIERSEHDNRLPGEPLFLAAILLQVLALVLVWMAGAAQ